MTYILGVKSPRFSAIISDTRVSRGDAVGPRQGANTVLKTGVLFPGCVFGLAGTAQPGNEFVQRARGELCRVADPEEGWREFDQLVRDYTFLGDESHSFSMLLSLRSSGRPQFFVLDSGKGLMPVDWLGEDCWVSLGSGRPILDPCVRERFLPDLNRLATEGFPFSAFPYVLCLRLTEMSQSLERDELESVGVGGVFHFVYQTPDCEGRQEPALHVICDAHPSTRRVFSWQYRVAFVGECLAVETLTPPEQNAADPSGEARTDLSFSSSLSPKEAGAGAEALMESIVREVEAQPFYYFCGVGFSNPRYRNFFLFDLSDGERYLWNRDGSVAAVWWNAICKNFE